MVIEHEENSGDDQDQKCSQRQCAQVPGGADAHHATPDLGGKQVQEHVLLNGQRAV